MNRADEALPGAPGLTDEARPSKEEPDWNWRLTKGWDPALERHWGPSPLEKVLPIIREMNDLLDGDRR